MASSQSSSRTPEIIKRRILCNFACARFYTPGFVMSMYALLRNNQSPSLADLEEAFQGIAIVYSIQKFPKKNQINQCDLCREFMPSWVQNVLLKGRERRV